MVEGQTGYTSEPRHGGLKRAQGQMDGLVKLADLCAAESHHEVFYPLPLGVSFPRYSTLRGGSLLQLEGCLGRVPV